MAPASMVNVVARLEAFAGMSRMKRLALVVLCHTVTDRHMTRLKVGAGRCAAGQALTRSLTGGCDMRVGSCLCASRPLRTSLTLQQAF